MKKQSVENNLLSDANVVNFSDRIEFDAHVKSKIHEVEVVLDIGCGVAPMSLFRPQLHIMVEPWHQYFDLLEKEFLGDKGVLIFRADALTVIRQLSSKSVDSIFLLDVIEHLEKTDGAALLVECERVAREQIIVFTPLGFMPQHVPHGEPDAWGLGGAEVQEHRSGWMPSDFGDGWAVYACIDYHSHDYAGRELAQKYGAMYAIWSSREPTKTISEKPLRRFRGPSREEQENLVLKSKLDELNCALNQTKSHLIRIEIENQRIRSHPVVSFLLSVRRCCLNLVAKIVR